MVVYLRIVVYYKYDICDGYNRYIVYTGINCKYIMRLLMTYGYKIYVYDSPAIICIIKHYDNLMCRLTWNVLLLY